MKFKILPIAGDASFRKFYRLKLKNCSRLIVFAPKERYNNLVAYTAINKFLINNKILAPKLYKHNLLKGILVVEDFGDTTFNKILVKKNDGFPEYRFKNRFPYISKFLKEEYKLHKEIGDYEILIKKTR